MNLTTDQIDQQNQLIKRAKAFVSAHPESRFPLESEWTRLPYQEQQRIFVRSLHKGNTGYVCLPRKKVFANNDDRFYIKDGKLCRKNPWFNNNFMPLGTDADVAQLVWGDTNDSYVSANPMDGSVNDKGVILRTDMSCAGVSDIHLDVDVLHDIKPYDTDLADAVIAVVLSTLFSVLPAPHMVTLSGRGFTWIYRYDKMLPNPTELDERGKVRHLNPDIERHDEMYKKFIAKVQAMFDPEIVEVDSRIVDHARVLRHAGTINRAAGRYATLLINNEDLFYAPEDLYRLLDLDQVVLPSSQKKSRKKKEEKEKIDRAPKQVKAPRSSERVLADNVIPFAPIEFRTAAKFRLPKMEQVPDYIHLVEGTGRHRFLFMYYCHARLLHFRDKAVKMAAKLNERFAEPLSTDEFNEFARQIERVDTHMELPWWEVHDNGIYIFGPESFAEFLPMSKETAIEHNFLDSYITRKSCEENQKDSMNRDYEIAVLWLSGLSHAKIADAIHGKYKYTSLDTVKSVTKRLGLTAARDTKIEDIDFEAVKRYKRQKGSARKPAEVIEISSVQADISTLNGGNFAKKQERRDIEKKTILTLEQNKALQGMLSQKNYFLSGIGGTGKSFVLERFVETVGKENVLVLAPSGKAASNIDGKTIHSGLALEPRPYGPNEPIHWQSINALKDVTYLIIDEIGMVRFDLFQHIMQIVEFTERTYHKDIHVICMGDFNQISPVMTNAERLWLQQSWGYDPAESSISAFSSWYWSNKGFWNPENMCLLRESRRHASDPLYAYALSQVYQQSRDQNLIAYLNQSYVPNMEFSETYMHICGRRQMVDAINQACISKHVKDHSFTVFHAQNCSGQRPENYHVAFDIPVYIGMPVLAMVNTKKYQNGTYGKIEKILKNGIVIRTEKDELVNVCVRKMSSADGKGCIKQLPVEPAYAITYHKAQGITVDHAIIHPECWEAGQLYVGLSRVRTKNGLILTAPIRPEYITSNQAALQAYQYICSVAG